MRWLWILVALSGCLKGGEFRCANDVDCDRGGAQGICQPNSFCSFADGECASGQRFAELSGDVSNQCVDGSGGFTVGGTVSGLTGTLTLANNGDALTLTASGSFTFDTPLADAAAYAVTVTTQPAGQTCIVANGSGAIAGASVTDVTVACGVVSASTILCSTNETCAKATEFCCFDRVAGMGVCQAEGVACLEQRVECDSADDCGGGNAVCCAEYAGGLNLKDATCRTSAADCAPAVSTEIWCEASAGAAACPAGQTCSGTPATSNPGYAVCE
jgi:hypothetical protein